MAPRKTPRKERGPGNYSAVGVEGRRTGTTLLDTGIRDENGLEPIPSFSSPAKTTPQPNGVTHDATYSADDSMDIDQSTMPEPTDVLRSVRNQRISLPPRATSPIKTHLNSSPRRSMGRRSVGPMSSPSKNLNNGTPTRAMSHPPNNKPVNRQLDFSIERPRQSIEVLPKETAKKSSKIAPKAAKGKNKRAFDLSVGADEDEELATDMSTVNGVEYDNEIIPQPDDQLILDGSFEQGAAGDNDVNQLPHVFGDDREMIETSAVGEVGGKKKTAKRGRKPKNAQVQVHRDTTMAPPPLPSKAMQQKQGPEERDPNARVIKKASAKSTSRAPSKAPARAGSVARSASVAARHRFLQRSETPANDDGALVTRSGRHSFKPLKSWLGEKAVMGDRYVDALPSVQEVVRVEEVVEEPKRRRGPVHRKPKRERTQLEVLEEDEEGDDLAAWELEPGIQVAEVMDWDPFTGKFDEESTKETDVAYSFDAIEMRDIHGAEFKFAKTLTCDFFGAGMVDLPPGGAKRIKNSRKMQMVFFVFYGRVMVTIGTPPTRFSIGKGGQWQVPRGNFYSIANESYTQSARLFFAQGCEMEPGAVDESTMA